MEPIPIQQVNHLDDLKKLYEITNPILGQTCCRAWLGYGEELKLEFGQTCEDWYLGGRGCDWILYVGQEEISSSKDSKESANERLVRLTNVPVVSFDTSYPDLSLVITFANDMRLRIISEFDPEYPRLSLWELFTPDDMLLEVGPKSKWRYTSAKEPINIKDHSYYDL